MERRAKSVLLFLGEQVVRPLDRRPQRLLAGIGVALALEQVEALGEPLEQLLGAEEGCAGGGELERERELVEAQAELAHRLARGESRIDRAGARQEERLSVAFGERGHGVGLLAADAQALPARDEHVEVGAGGEERRELGRRLHDLLEVVEEAEHRLVRDVLGEAVLGAERLRRGREDERRVAQRRERDPPHAVGVGVGGQTSRLQRESRLPRATRPGQGEEARVVCSEELDDLGELLLASEEGCRWHRQVRAVQALERREVAVSELVDALGSDRGP